MTGERRRAALVMACIGLTLSLLCGWLPATSVIAAWTAWHSGAATIRVSGGDVAMLVLLPVFVALAAWGSIAAVRDGAATRRIGNAIAIVAMVAVPIALAGAWGFVSWAERRLADEGYVRCATGRVGRFPALALCLRPNAPRPGPPPAAAGGPAR